MSMDEVEQSSRSHLVKKNKNLATALEEARTYLAKVCIMLSRVYFLATATVGTSLYV